MSNTTIRPIPTLRGMFSVQRAQQGRNFLKENKLSLRSLEKATTEKLAAKEPVRPKWMPPLRRTSSDAREPKRCDQDKSSTSDEREHCLLRSSSQQHLAVPQAGERFDGLGGREPMHYESHNYQPPPQQRPTPLNYQPPQRQAPQHYQPPPQRQAEHHPGLRCQSCGTERSATSIGIQTEDIMDEIYLSNALKKCNFDSKSLLSDGRSLRNGVAGDYEDNYRGYNAYEDENELPLQQQVSPRMNDNAQYNKRRHLLAHDFIGDDKEIMPLPDLHELNNADGYAMDEEAPLSARSRATIASTATTKSKRREHKLGSRDELILPRYLEKEKRDKVEAQQRAQARDPDCPRGHVMLSEEERLTQLSTFKQQFDRLVSELNHMPMTTQTLRVRTRKAEIDKELTVVEDKIRTLSKPKVFVLSNHIQNP